MPESLKSIEKELKMLEKEPKSKKECLKIWCVKRCSKKEIMRLKKGRGIVNNTCSYPASPPNVMPKVTGDPNYTLYKNK